MTAGFLKMYASPWLEIFYIPGQSLMTNGFGVDSELHLLVLTASVIAAFVDDYLRDRSLKPSNYTEMAMLLQSLTAL